MKDPIEEMEELRIPSIILDNMLLLIGEAKNVSLFSEDCRRLLDEKFQNLL